MLPQSIGPFRGHLPKILARFVLRRAAIVATRDTRASPANVEALLGVERSKAKLRTSLDVAFALPVDRQTPWCNVLLGKRSASSVLIGLNVSGLMWNGGYSQRNMFRLRFDYQLFCEDLSQAILSRAETHLILIPHTVGEPESVNNDLVASLKLVHKLEQFRARITVVDEDISPQRVKAVIGGVDFFVGGRMHACIAALSQAIPCVGIAYSDKFDGVFRSVGVPELVLDARTISLQNALGRVMGLLGDRKQIERKLTENSKRVESSTSGLFTEIVEGATTVSPS